MHVLPFPKNNVLKIQIFKRQRIQNAWHVISMQENQLSIFNHFSSDVDYIPSSVALSFATLGIFPPLSELSSP